MDLRALIEKLTLLENTITLQSVAATEKAAAEQAQKSASSDSMWDKLTSWDPRTAGNIALAKLAQEHNLSGLFNSEGDFVIAYGTNGWSSVPGQAPRTAPPTPDDWKPLAGLGLIPQNAKGPAGLTNLLTGDGAQQEFDDAKHQSTSMASGQLDGAEPEDQGAKYALDPGEEIVPADKPATDEEDLDTLVNKYLSLVKADEVKPLSEDPYTFLSYSISETLVESFGYTTEATVSWGDGSGTYTWDSPILTLDDGTVLYTFTDLAFDLGISIAAIGVGTILAVPTGGASEAAAGAVIGPRLVNLARLIRIWWDAFKAPMTVFKNKAGAKTAIRTFVRTHIDGFKRSVAKVLNPKNIATVVAGTVGINWLFTWLGDHLSDEAKEKLLAGAQWVADKIPNSVKRGVSKAGDWIGDKVGIEHD